MIQRIQSVYLLLAAILGVVCLSQPLGHLITADGERYATLYNLWLRTTEGGTSFSPWVLFALLLGISAGTLLNIFLFRRRALQMRVATTCMILLTGYYASLAFFAWNLAGDGSFRPSLTAALPFVCLVLDYLAFRGILKDEMLVRSLDRLR